MGAAKQIVRGMGTLPHVGEHPGTGLMLNWIAAGTLAGGIKGGIVGILGGATIMIMGLGPLYLWGAYDRARISDRMSNPHSAGGSSAGSGISS